MSDDTSGVSLSDLIAAGVRLRHIDAVTIARGAGLRWPYEGHPAAIPAPDALRLLADGGIAVVGRRQKEMTSGARRDCWRRCWHTPTRTCRLPRLSGSFSHGRLRTIRQHTRRWISSCRRWRRLPLPTADVVVRSVVGAWREQERRDGCARRVCDGTRAAGGQAQASGRPPRRGSFTDRADAGRAAAERAAIR